MIPPFLPFSRQSEMKMDGRNDEDGDGFNDEHQTKKSKRREKQQMSCRFCESHDTYTLTQPVIIIIQQRYFVIPLSEFFH